ncbi:hypothetical protein QTI05_24020 [Variovorax sp. J22R193]|nr:hypothetical protein [Variovorax sp. J22R193]MDM0042126.1 hypothetical protein [Variovorax sp. J22R193]
MSTGLLIFIVVASSLVLSLVWTKLLHQRAAKEDEQELFAGVGLND